MQLFRHILFSRAEMLNQEHSTANACWSGHSVLPLGRVGGFREHSEEGRQRGYVILLYDLLKVKRGGIPIKKHTPLLSCFMMVTRIAGSLPNGGFLSLKEDGYVQAYVLAFCIIPKYLLKLGEEKADFPLLSSKRVIV